MVHCCETSCGHGISPLEVVESRGKSLWKECGKPGWWMPRFRVAITCGGMALVVTSWVGVSHRIPSFRTHCICVTYIVPACKAGTAHTRWWWDGRGECEFLSARDHPQSDVAATCWRRSVDESEPRDLRVVSRPIGLVRWCSWWATSINSLNLSSRLAHLGPSSALRIRTA